MTRELYFFLKAADEFAANFSDGAWHQSLLDAVATFNKKNRTKYNPEDTVFEYLDLNAAGGMK